MLSRKFIKTKLSFKCDIFKKIHKSRTIRMSNGIVFCGFLIYSLLMECYVLLRFGSFKGSLLSREKNSFTKITALRDQVSRHRVV